MIPVEAKDHFGRMRRGNWSEECTVKYKVFLGENMAQNQP